ncbi:MAG: hypothetical protein HOV80_06820 [Polyangiaceae bacterium]|nr:hypothetical protein [Polyangiaceae bacterium]
MTLYARDRPIICESQSSELTRGEAYTWELEKWRFGKMYVSLVPYTFDPEDEDYLSDHFSGDDPPEWVTELAWRIDVSGRNPDDAFFDWFHARAEASRGIIYDPYRDVYDERIVSFEPPTEPWLAELMLGATRPCHSNTDDRASLDLQRNEPATQEDVESYGASLDALEAAGLRVSWEAMQYLYVGLDGEPGEIVFKLFAPNRGPRDPRALLRITAHPDPEIDGLARDPEGVPVLRDLLLVRNEPVPPLLHDLVAPSELVRAPLQYSAATKNELVELWERVIGLEGRLDIGRMYDEIRRPRMEES